MAAARDAGLPLSRSHKTFLEMYSSRREDFEAVMNYVWKGYKMADAIEAVLADRSKLRATAR